MPTREEIREALLKAIVANTDAAARAGGSETSKEFAETAHELALTMQTLGIGVPQH